MRHYEDHGEVQIGTVGWEGDSEVAELGDEADRHTLVKVTLHVGRNRSEELQNPAIATGRRIRAQISAPMFHVPKRGTVVWVVRAGGTDAWMLVANPTPNATDQFKGTARTLLDFGDETDVIIRGKSISLQSAAGHFLGLGPNTGFQVGDPDACGVQLKNKAFAVFIAEEGDAKNTLKMTKDFFAVAQKSGAGVIASMKVEGGTVKAAGNSFVAAVGNVALGAGALPTQQAAYIVGGIPAPSLTVFLQP